MAQQISFANCCQLTPGLPAFNRVLGNIMVCPQIFVMVIAGFLLGCTKAQQEEPTSCPKSIIKGEPSTVEHWTANDTKFNTLRM